MRYRRGMMPNDFPMTPSYTVNSDPGDENDSKVACQYCGSTDKKDLSVSVSSSEPGRVGKATCGKCIFERGNAAARRLAGADGWSV